ncbi:pyrroline-5-carboxylate reductase family protein [Desulfurobacterium thermolithotrophum]|uniref:pyrroline-5-carboxylate reductase family protein n=1 Tax=Desulfurobacterium thermolithotrophum TaxID=64160 RepID=UPI0013D213AC|nr:NAD(P)-binding domain-containing protein [Desulfurobacterium thermolithotrophum]
MVNKTMGFIGGGRITRIILEGLRKGGYKIHEGIVVSDVDIKTLNELKEKFPEISVSFNDNSQPASKEIVFIALPLKVADEVFKEIKNYLNPDSIVVSLVPKISIARISESLNGIKKIVRMVPNAPSIINEGYNPVCFSPFFTKEEKIELLSLFSILGACPEVSEEKLEAYTVLTAVGPTYFWFQLYHLHKLAKSFGLSEQEAEDAILNMIKGTVDTMYKSKLSPKEVMDLVAIKPLEDVEEDIKNMYSSRLKSLFRSLKD